MSNHDDMDQCPYGLVAVSFRVDEKFLSPFERGGEFNTQRLGLLRGIGITNIEGKTVCNGFLMPDADEAQAQEFLMMLCEAREFK